MQVNGQLLTFKGHAKILNLSIYSVNCLWSPVAVLYMELSVEFNNTVYWLSLAYYAALYK